MSVTVILGDVAMDGTNAQHALHINTTYSFNSIRCLCRKFDILFFSLPVEKWVQFISCIFTPGTSVHHCAFLHFQSSVVDLTVQGWPMDGQNTLTGWVSSSPAHSVLAMYTIWSLTLLPVCQWKWPVGVTHLIRRLSHALAKQTINSFCSHAVSTVSLALSRALPLKLEVEYSKSKYCCTKIGKKRFVLTKCLVLKLSCEKPVFLHWIYLIAYVMC